MRDYLFTPEGYVTMMREAVPGYDRYVVTEIDPEVDHPSTLEEQLAWLEAAGLLPEVTWTHRDLVVIVGRPA